MIVIIGGGIAGLFTLARLKKSGYPVVLLEQNGLGGGQTLASQGIIHGGVKYALNGLLTGAAQAIAQMPARWQALRKNAEEPHLAEAALLSPQQYLWTMGALGDNLTAFFAGKLMRSRMQKLAPADYPDFLPADFAGVCYGLQEPVFDIFSVLRAFERQYGDCIYTDAVWQRDGKQFHIQTPEVSLNIDADEVIYCAGAGNEAASGAAQQLRPLHMVALRVPQNAPNIYGHCLGMSDKPKITVTTHPYDALAPDSGKVYWLGGQPAEEGVVKTQEEQIDAVRQVFLECVPWLPAVWLDDARQFRCVRVMRAEGLSGGHRPDLPVLTENAQGLTVWATKLAFAPLVADWVLEKIQQRAAVDRVVINELPPHTLRIAPLLWQQ